MDDTKETGVVHIADDVVAVIASMATLDTEGVTSMSEGIVEGFARRVSGKQVHRGVQVRIEGNEAEVYLRIIVQYGQKIDALCRKVQKNVKEAVEQMTGLYVNRVDVRVEDVDLATETQGEVTGKAPQENGEQNNAES